jgi:ferritin-like metal-binding protein YciE
MPVTDLHSLFVDTLKDTYNAEKQLVKALPKMVKKAASPELKAALEHHLSETEGQIDRLDDVFAEINQKAVGKKCEAMEGLVKEASDLMSEVDDERALDAGIIMAAQSVEHYEIARYGTLISWARELELDGVQDLLQETLEEEKAADEKLSSLAESFVNRQAA